MVDPYYQKDGITIYHGDCRDILPELEPVDLVLTDPPYGIQHKSNGQIFLKSQRIANDGSLDLVKWIRGHARKHKIQLCMFYSPYRPLKGFRSVLVWNKGGHVGIGGDREKCWKRDFELIGVEHNEDLKGTRDSAVLNCNAVSPPPTGHVAEKPTELMTYLLSKFETELVCDPFMGSGSTLVAAKMLGIDCVGIELEEKWCRVAMERVEFGAYKSVDRTKRAKSVSGFGL